MAHTENGASKQRDPFLGYIERKGLGNRFRGEERVKKNKMVLNSADNEREDSPDIQGGGGGWGGGLMEGSNELRGICEIRKGSKGSTKK